MSQFEKSELFKLQQEGGQDSDTNMTSVELCISCLDCL